MSLESFTTHPLQDVVKVPRQVECLFGVKLVNNGDIAVELALLEWDVLNYWVEVKKV